MQNEIINTKLLSGAAISLAGKFLGAGFLFLSQILLARHLGPKDFGLYSIGWSFFQISGIVATFGLDSAVIKFGSEFWDGKSIQLKSLIIKTNLFSLFLSVFFVLLLNNVYKLVLDIFNRNDLVLIFQLFIIGVPFFVILRLNSATSRITENMKYSIVAEEIVRKGIQLLLTIIIIQFGISLTDSIIVTIISFSIASVLIIQNTFNLFLKNIKTDFRDNLKYRIFFKFSIYVTGSSITSSILIWSDRILLGLLRPTNETGLYQAASQVTFIFSTILLAVNTVIAPMIASLYHKNDIISLRNLFRSSTKYIFYLGLPLAIVIFINPDLILGGLYGDKYLSGTTILILVTITQIINIGTGAVAQILLMTGEERKWFWFTFTAFLINISINFILIPDYGSFGAAIGSGLSLTFLNILGLISSKKITGIYPYDRRLLKGVLATFITTIILVIINKFYFEINFFTLIGMLVYSYFFFIMSIVLIGIDEEDKNFLLALRNRIFNKGF